MFTFSKSALFINGIVLQKVVMKIFFNLNHIRFRGSCIFGHELVTFCGLREFFALSSVMLNNLTLLGDEGNEYFFNIVFNF